MSTVVFKVKLCYCYIDVNYDKTTVKLAFGNKYMYIDICVIQHASIWHMLQNTVSIKVKTSLCQIYFYAYISKLKLPVVLVATHSGFREKENMFCVCYSFHYPT